MKKWVVIIDNKERVCNLVRAFPYSKQLMLEYDGKEFFIIFKHKENYMDAKIGTKSPCFIANKAKTTHMIATAVFKVIIK